MKHDAPHHKQLTAHLSGSSVYPSPWRASDAIHSQSLKSHSESDWRGLRTTFCAHDCLESLGIRYAQSLAELEIEHIRRPSSQPWYLVFLQSAYRTLSTIPELKGLDNVLFW